MRSEKEKIRRAFVFRAIFALEAGGGMEEIEAEDRKQAIKKLRKKIPFFDHKVKTVEILKSVY